MTERPVGVTDTASGAGIAQVRTRERTVASETVSEQYVIPISERVVSYRGYYSTWRTLGVASTPHHIFALKNDQATTNYVGVTELLFYKDMSAALASLAPIVTISRTAAAPTGGTALTAVASDTAQSLSGSVTALAATASDGGTATAITATAGTVGWRVPQTRLHTAVGQVIHPRVNLLPEMCQQYPFVLDGGQWLLVQVVAAALTTDHYEVNCAFEAYTLP